jgi:hypothetical protein
MISRAEGEPGSNCGFHGLAAALEGKEDLLEEIRASYSMSIWWYGISDSDQPGFYFTMDALRRISALGCDVMGNSTLRLGPEGAPLMDRVAFRTELDFETLETPRSGTS